MTKVYNVCAKKYPEVLCLTALKTDGKFGGKMTCAFKIDMYGCSFVSKLSWKKYIFFEKICFLRNVRYLQKKCFYMEKKSFILKFSFTKKNSFYRAKYKWKWKIYIYIYISF